MFLHKSPLHVWFLGEVFGDGGSNGGGAISSLIKPKIAANAGHEMT